MRIAVSGTHASGKSTLIEAWLALHSHYVHEPEPYTTLQEIYGEGFADPPAIADFERQLEFQSEALARYTVGENVVFERSPADFLAYMLVLHDRTSRRHAQEVQGWVDTVRAALRCLDLIVFLPLDEHAHIDVPADEDLELRHAVNERLRDILLDDEFRLFDSGSPVITEARGPVRQRLESLTRALKAEG